MPALCALEDVPAGGGKEVSTPTAEGHRWIVLFRVAGDVVAYLNTCPHQGRSLAFAPDEFLLDPGNRLICPHHGACFDLVTGECIEGPCKGASLTPVPIEVRDGEVSLA